MAVRNINRTFMNKIIDFRSSVRFYSNQTDDGAQGSEEQKIVDPSKDRTKIIPVETSIRYMQSTAYQQTYENNFVWSFYRRNHRGGLAPRKTRKSCVRNGVISTGNPCPICRDEYLVLDHRNTKLLEQFISQYTGQLLDAFETGLCQKKQKELMVAVERAWDQGYLTYDVPFREYNYTLYTKTNVS